MRSKPLYELQSRVLYFLMAMLVYRLGTHITIPGIDGQELARLFSSGDGLSFFSFLNFFTGSALERMSIFSLGIGPYISASIVTTLMTPTIPYLERLKKEEGDTGRRKLNQYTRYLTILIGLIQSSALCTWMVSSQIIMDANWYFYFQTILSLLAGTIFLMWLGEQVTEYGIGNGISLLIFASIASKLPDTCIAMSSRLQDGSMSFATALSIFSIIVIIMLVIVSTEKALRKIPICLSRGSNFTQAGGAGTKRSMLPLKMNMSGVLPVICVMMLMNVPSGIAKMFLSSDNYAIAIIDKFLEPTNLLYIVVTFMFITLFCFLINAMINNPKDMADNLKKSGSLIPGIRPGANTAQYLDKVMSRLTLGGSVYISGVVLLPQIVSKLYNIPFHFGGTSLLIMVVVILDLLTQVMSYIYSAAYGDLNIK